MVVSGLQVCVTNYPGMILYDKAAAYSRRRWALVLMVGLAVIRAEPELPHARPRTGGKKNEKKKQKKLELLLWDLKNSYRYVKLYK